MIREYFLFLRKNASPSTIRLSKTAIKAWILKNHHEMNNVLFRSELAYDRKGNVLAEKRTLDDLQVIFQRTYDVFDRVKTITYPEGTLVRNHYSNTGQLGFLTMDSHDGNSLNHTVVSYEGPKQDGTNYYLERKTGNGVTTKIAFDPIRQRPLSYQTRLKDNTLEHVISYEYDSLNRVTKSKVKQGEVIYS